MKSWVRKRQNQISILLIGITVVTVSNFILPAYETLSYYRAKTELLEKQYNKLHGYSLHIERYEKFSQQLQDQVSELEQQFANLRNPTFLQKQFGSLQRKHSLTVATQEFKKLNMSKELEGILIYQTLNGKYHDHVHYLNNILNKESRILLERYHLESRTLFNTDPILTAQISMTLFIPSK